jgi:hypothetical protein
MTSGEMVLFVCPVEADEGSRRMTARLVRPDGEEEAWISWRSLASSTGSFPHSRQQTPLHAFMKVILNAAADCFLTLSDEDGMLSNSNEFRVLIWLTSSTTSGDVARPFLDLNECGMSERLVNCSSVGLSLLVSLKVLQPS